MNNRIKKIDNPDEFLFNSVLRDYLRKNNPPGLLSKIMAELAARDDSASESRDENESLGNLQISHIELDEALGAAQADLDYAVMSPPVQSNLGESVRTKSYRLEPYFWEYRAFKKLLGLTALAASVAISVAGYQFWNQTKTESSIARVQSDLPSIPDAPSEPQTEQPNDEKLAQSEVKPDGESLASPTPVVEPAAPKVVHVAKPTRKILTQPEPLELSRLTDVINSQLRLMWKKHGVEPKLIRGEDEVWLVRATEGILGRSPTYADLELFRQEKGSDRFAKTVESLVNSEEFNLHWSRVITECFLSQSIGMTPRREIADLVSWVKTELDKGSSVGQIERLLLEVGFEENDPDRNVKLSLFNNTKNRLVSIEGEIRGMDKFLLLRSNDRDTSYVHLANQVLHATGNGTASCVQCHDADSSVMRVISPPDREIANQFWNFAAAVKVVAKSRERPTMELGREDQELFYDLKNGNRQIAKPGLTVARVEINSDLGDDDQVTLHEWIEQSHDARKGLAEAVWTKMLQQPLVPPFKLTEDEADTERQDLKDLLAKQLQATGDIKTLIQSIVLSDAFFVPEAKVSKSWYLTASDAQLSKYHQGARLFSYIPIETTRIAADRSKSTNVIAKWLEVEKRRTGNPSALAQPQTSKVVQNSPSTDKFEPENIDQVRFLLSSSRPYYGIERLANQLAESKMEWDDKVNHLFLLLKGRYPMQAERFDAKYTLTLVQENQLKALIYICTSQLGSY
jgi:hypothetical protein